MEPCHVAGSTRGTDRTSPGVGQRAAATIRSARNHRFLACSPTPAVAMSAMAPPRSRRNEARRPNGPPHASRRPQRGSQSRRPSAHSLADDSLPPARPLGTAWPGGLGLAVCVCVGACGSSDDRTILRRDVALSPAPSELDCDPEAVIRGGAEVSERRDLDALRGVVEIEGTLAITGDVESLGPLACLRRVGGGLILRDLDRATNLLLPRLEQIGEGLDVVAIPRAERLVLGALRHVGEGASLNVEQAPRLHRLQLPRLPAVERDLLLRAIGSEAREALDLDLRRLTRVGDRAVIQAVDNLEDLSGLSSLRSAARLAVVSNANLSSLVDLRGLSDANVCDVAENPRLPSCETEVLHCRERTIVANLSDDCSP